jgi:hypothetical protein
VRSTDSVPVIVNELKINFDATETCTTGVLERPSDVGILKITLSLLGSHLQTIQRGIPVRVSLVLLVR